MPTVTKSGGTGAYCIDIIEVTKGEYTMFITANVDIQSQPTACKPPTNSS